MKKGLIIITTFLFLSSTSLGLVGYSQNKLMTKSNEIKEDKPTIIYEYYLDDMKVTKEETDNVKEELDLETSSTITKKVDNIEFVNFDCDNGIIGTFDKEAWNFIPSTQKSGTCKLYFKKTYYDLTFTITNGELEENVDTKVKREQNGIFKVKPNEGYKFDSITCSNNKEASWDEQSSSIIVNAVTEDTTCKVVFNIKRVSYNVKVVNGTGSYQTEVDYGKNVSNVVTPNQGYEYNNKSSITCTNNQVAEYSNNSLKINKLTDNTECTITFSLKETETYNVQINLPEHIKITKGGTANTVNKSSSLEFSLKPDDTYEINTVVCDGIEPAKISTVDKTVTYKLYDITKNITCTVTEKSQ